MAAYAMFKHVVEAYSESVDHEIREYGGLQRTTDPSHAAVMRQPAAPCNDSTNPETLT